MLPEIKYLPVCWIDGMKISQAHFNQLENSIVDRIRDSMAVRLTDFNYGLLSPKPGSTTSLDIAVSLDQSGLMRVRLNECRAITAGGIRIEISGVNAFSFNAFESSNNIKDDETAYVVLVVNPFAPTPFGEPDPEETPLRYPFTLASVRLELIPSLQLNTRFDPAYHLLLGRLIKVDGKMCTDAEFIPPVTSVQSYPKLLQEYNTLGSLLGQLGQNATIIVQKVKSERQKTDLSLNIMYLAEKIVFFLADKIAGYRLRYPQLPPIHIVDTFLSFAYLVKSTLDCQVEKNREELLKYFQQWTNLNPAQFESAINNVISIEYNHQDICTPITEIKKFATVILNLFQQLVKLKYIGDQPDSGIVIGEAIAEPKKSEARRGWSFLNE
jgi:predicted component of type VI protein secretion system